MSPPTFSLPESERRVIQTRVFVLEGLNSFAVTFYFYYFYFFTRLRFGFGNKENLLLAAASGLVYMLAAYLGGRFAQRAGYFAALKLGFGSMAVLLTAGGLVAASPTAHIAIMLGTAVGMCFTWPTLEAMVSEGESYAGLQRNIGIYNVVWAGTGALAYFVGGAALEQLGMRSLFFVPVGILGLQLVLTRQLEQRCRAVRWFTPGQKYEPPPGPAHSRPPARAHMFLRLAWWSNPFAYVAINTLVAVMPGVAQRLALSTTLAGICGSLWCFARLGAFFGFWFWPGWHYRFRWLLAASVALIGTFLVILLSRSLLAVMAAQIVFGVAIGLIYYSSLFYSMDVGETKGEHGGIHEAAIGLGNFAGPAVGAASLHFLPQSVHGGAWAVAVLLLGGLGGLLVIRAMTRT